MKIILLIEDDESQRILYRSILEKAGYEVLEAPNGDIGCQIYRKESCDMIITDMFMPEKEGMETILELKAEFPDIKILAISGGGALGETETILEAAKDFGATEILSKPIKKELFLESVSRVLAGS